MSKIEIKEAYNGWIIEASGESRHEPRVFEYDGTNRFRTTLENRLDTIARALTHVLASMIGSPRYRIVVMEDEDAKSNIPTSDRVPTEALPGGLPASASLDVGEVQARMGVR